MRTAMLLVITLVLAAGCGGEAAAAKLSGPLTYVRTGGEIGERQELTVQPDGKATLAVARGTKRRSGQFTLSPQELAALTGALDKAGFSELPADTGGKPVPDGFSHTIGYRGKQVKTIDFAAPAELKPLLKALQDILEKHRPR